MKTINVIESAEHPDSPVVLELYDGLSADAVAGMISTCKAVDAVQAKWVGKSGCLLNEVHLDGTVYDIPDDCEFRNDQPCLVYRPSANSDGKFKVFQRHYNAHAHWDCIDSGVFNLVDLEVYLRGKDK